jgi:hypothetical protein
MKSIFTSLLLLLFLGCHLFEPTQVPRKEIVAASSWSEKDQAPTFPSCEDREDLDEKHACFESIISNSIKEYILQNPWESSEYLEEEISLQLRIDRGGVRTGSESDTTSKPSSQNKCRSFCFN